MLGNLGCLYGKKIHKECYSRFTQSVECKNFSAEVCIKYSIVVTVLLPCRDGDDDDHSEAVYK